MPPHSPVGKSDDRNACNVRSNELANGDYTITVTTTTSGDIVPSQSHIAHGYTGTSSSVATSRPTRTSKSRSPASTSPSSACMTRPTSPSGLRRRMEPLSRTTRSRPTGRSQGAEYSGVRYLFGEPDRKRTWRRILWPARTHTNHGPQDTVTVTLPDGRTEVLVFEPRGGCSDDLEVLPRFAAKAGTTRHRRSKSTNRPKSSTDSTAPSTKATSRSPGPPYFLLTTRSGMKYVLNTEHRLIRRGRPQPRQAHLRAQRDRIERRTTAHVHA